MRDAESLKIRPWAVDGDRLDPDDATNRHRLVRSVGWPASFSQENGPTPQRRVFNQLHCEITSMLDEINRKGVLEWDATAATQIGYLEDAIVQHVSRLWRATQDRPVGAPAKTNTHWAEISGQRSAPTKLTVTATPLNGQVQLNWGFPVSVDPITAIRIRYKSGSQSYDPDSIRNALLFDWMLPALSIILDGLANGTEYDFQVRAENAVGNGAWSDEVSAIPAGLAPSVPPGLTYHASHQQVQLNWENATPYGSPITGYTVQQRTAPSGAWADIATVSGLTHTATGLTDNQAYDFRVRANSAAGSSAFTGHVRATPAPSYVRFDSSEANWPWPWTNATSAVITVRGGQGGPRGGGSSSSTNPSTPGQESTVAIRRSGSSTVIERIRAPGSAGAPYNRGRSTFAAFPASVQRTVSNLSTSNVFDISIGAGGRQTADEVRGGADGYVEIRPVFD